MRMTAQMVNLDPRQKKANVFLVDEKGVSVQILGMPFDPPEGLPYNKCDEAAVQEAVALLHKVESQ